MKTQQQGFTLVELMITVAIVAVVMGIAIPSYQGYIRDTQAAQAASDLKACAMTLERFYSRGFTYAGADTAGAGGAPLCNTQSPTEGETAYNISMQTLNATSVLIRATPVGETCGTGNCIELDQTGDQTLN